jgi:hypothetical protein
MLVPVNFRIKRLPLNSTHDGADSRDYTSAYSEH